MKIFHRISIGIILSSVLVVLFFFIYSVNHDNASSSSVPNDNSSARFSYPYSNYTLNPVIEIGKPVRHENTTMVGNTGLRFDLYEDYPIKIKRSDLNIEDLKTINVPDGVWTKFTSNMDTHPNGNNTSIILHVMGAIDPSYPTPFNNTFYVDTKLNGSHTHILPLTVIKNRVLNEVSVLRGTTPVKFKNILFVTPTANVAAFYGLVNDVNSTFASKTSSDNLLVNVEPLGIIDNGTLSSFPKWIDVSTQGSPLSLKPNGPTYYAVLISTTNAPPGSYEIAMREKINDRIFIETMTLIVNT